MIDANGRDEEEKEESTSPPRRVASAPLPDPPSKNVRDKVRMPSKRGVSFLHRSFRKPSWLSESLPMRGSGAATEAQKNWLTEHRRARARAKSPPQGSGEVGVSFVEPISEKTSAKAEGGTEGKSSSLSSVKTLDSVHSASQMYSRRALPDLPELQEIKPKSFDYDTVLDSITKTPVNEGAQAYIYKCHRKASDEKSHIFAVKVLKPHNSQEESELEAFRREVHLLFHFHHENICRLVAVSTSPQGLPVALLEWVPFSCQQALLLQHVGHDPMARSQVEKRFPGQKRLEMMIQLASALVYLHGGSAVHGCAVIHRDLKPQNFGITEAGTFKLLDFGLAVCCQIDDVSSTQGGGYETYKLTGETGSIRYMAPEVAKHQEKYGTRVDCYSFALTAWEILSLAGKPFPTFNVYEHAKKVVHGGVRPPIPLGWNSSLKAIIEAAWHANQQERPDMPIILEALEKIDEAYHKNLDPLGLTVGPVSAGKTRCC